MRLTRFDNPTAFAVRALPFLAEREAEHCLPIGLINRLAGGETVGDGAPYLALIDDDVGDVIEALVMTPPFNLILSHLAPSAQALAEKVMRVAAEDARAFQPDLPGVIGPDDEARHFADQWMALTGQRARIAIQERVFRLERVRPPRPAPGQMRYITEADRPLLREWLRAFAEEALGDLEDLNADAEIDWRLRSTSGGMVLWLDNAATPVSLTGYGNPTLHGIRVGPVYTPPEERGRGYASALVAAISQQLLDNGRQFVFLFTNLANPTSNHIYQAIGYEPVGDATVYRFEPDA